MSLGRLGLPPVWVKGPCFREEAIEWHPPYDGAMLLIVEHLGIDRKIAAQIDGAAGFRRRSREPMQYHTSTWRWHMLFDHVEDDLGRPDAMHSEDLVSRRGAGG